MSELVIKLPADVAAEFLTFWKDLRVAEGLDQEIDLGEPVLSDNFDGAAVAAWVISISPVVAPVLTAIFGYLIAKRGELEVQKGDTTIRMKNLKPSQVKEYLATIDEHL
jgi:hypothetical protein